MISASILRQIACVSTADLMNALGGIMFRCLDNVSQTVAFLSVLSVAAKGLDSKKAT